MSTVEVFIFQHILQLLTLDWTLGSRGGRKPFVQLWKVFDVIGQAEDQVLFNGGELQIKFAKLSLGCLGYRDNLMCFQSCNFDEHKWILNPCSFKLTYKVSGQSSWDGPSLLLNSTVALGHLKSGDRASKVPHSLKQSWFMNESTSVTQGPSNASLM